jgi:hypothetical protein
MNNVEKYGGARGATNDVTIWRIRVACWISRTTRTHAHEHAHTYGHPHTHVCTHSYTHRQIKYCFSTARMIRESPSVLRHTYIVCLVISIHRF